MADRGMVTEAIEKCLNFDDACNDCLYEGCVFKYGSCTKDLLADALVLLKGKEPIFPGIKQDCCGIVYVCGACGATLYKIRDTASAEYKIQHVRFCPECGREVKIARNDAFFIVDRRSGGRSGGRRMSEDYIASLVLVLLGIIVGFIIGLYTGLLFKK